MLDALYMKFFIVPKTIVLLPRINCAAALDALMAREAALSESESAECEYLTKIEDIKKRLEAIDKTLAKSV